MPSPRPPSPLRVVLFDAGNTLLGMDYAALADHLGSYGLPVTAADVERAEWRARVLLDEELTRAGVSTESGEAARAYVGHMLAGLGVADPGMVAAVAAWRRACNPPFGVWTRPAPGAREAVAAVRAAGAAAAIVSNSDGTVRAILEALGLTGGVDFVVDSHEVGVEKPDPRIFRLALARAGAAPEEAAYIGDLYSVDVLGARTAGLRAVLLDPGGCWPPRDCPVAADALAAVRLLIGSTGGSGCSPSPPRVPGPPAEP